MRSVIVICNSRVTLLVFGAQMAPVIISCWKFILEHEDVFRVCMPMIHQMEVRYKDEQVVMQLVGCMVTKTL